MNEMFYRQSALDCIANGLLKNYRNGMYLYGAPRSIPIEEIIEVEYKLTIEYVKLRKSGNVLGQTVFENCFVPVYDAQVAQIDDYLRVHELVKIKVLDNSMYTAREAAEEIAEKISAEVVQVIGSKAVLYKRNEKQPVIKLKSK